MKDLFYKFIIKSLEYQVISTTLLMIPLAFLMCDFTGLQVALSGIGLFSFIFLLLYLIVTSEVGLFPEAKNKKLNIFGYLGLFILGIVGYAHFLTIDETYKPTKIEFEITDGSRFLMFESDQTKPLRVDYSDIKYDKENPLEIYDGYKIDIFGYESYKEYFVKSNLMNDYVGMTKVFHE